MNPLIIQIEIIIPLNIQIIRIQICRRSVIDCLHNTVVFYTGHHVHHAERFPSEIAPHIDAQIAAAEGSRKNRLMIHTLFGKYDGSIRLQIFRTRLRSEKRRPGISARHHIQKIRRQKGPIGGHNKDAPDIAEITRLLQILMSCLLRRHLMAVHDTDVHAAALQKKQTADRMV